MSQQSCSLFLSQLVLEDFLYKAKVNQNPNPYSGTGELAIVTAVLHKFEVSSKQRLDFTKWMIMSRNAAESVLVIARQHSSCIVLQCTHCILILQNRPFQFDIGRHEIEGR